MDHKALLLNLRWLNILLAFGWVQLDNPAHFADTAMVAALGIFLVSNLALGRLSGRLFTHHPAWFLLSLFDITLISFMIFQMGVFRGDTFFLYLPAVASAACIHGQRGIFATVTAAALAYGVMAWRMLPPGALFSTSPEHKGLLFRIAVLAVVGISFGYLAQRLRHQTLGKSRIASEREDLEAVVDATHAISSSLHQTEVLGMLIQQVVTLVGAFRCSVVHVDESKVGNILISREILATKEGVRTPTLRVDLDNYPEIKEALKKGRSTVIDDVSLSPLMAGVAHKLEAVGIRSLLVVPVTIDDSMVGTQLLCLGRRERPFSSREIKVCELITNVAANVLKNAYVHESLASENLSLQKLAISDPLTGLYNRRFFDMRLSEEFRLASRHDLPLSLVLLDVDHFKRINDTHGHLVGDRVLKELARVAQASMRHSDCLARYGGEEFVMLLPLTDREGALAKAEEVRLAVKELVHRAGKKSIRTTISVGVADFDPKRCPDPETLVARADHAVYMAKQGGRDRVCADEGGKLPEKPPSKPSQESSKAQSGKQARSKQEAPARKKRAP